MKSGDGKPKAAPKPAEESEEPASEAAPAAEDSASGERIEALRAGLEEALAQSREILSMLDATPASKAAATPASKAAKEGKK